MNYDIVIAGGGPAGLSAALALGRARKRVLLCDSGPPRNAAAVHLHNFVTRDGITPGEFRRIARQQLQPYRGVEVRDVRVEEIRGERGDFQVRLAGGETVSARLILLTTGMIDLLPEIDGLRALWGKAVFICPYCHAWEVQDRRFAYLASGAEGAEFPLFLKAWTDDVTLLTDGRFDVPADLRDRLRAGGIPIEERKLTRLVARGEELERIEFSSGSPLPMDILFLHPPQRQVGLVASLGLDLDARGYVRVHETTRETSTPGIYAAGDLLTPAQGALLSAAAGMQAAAHCNHTLTVAMAAYPPVSAGPVLASATRPA